MLANIGNWTTLANIVISGLLHLLRRHQHLLRLREVLGRQVEVLVLRPDAGPRPDPPGPEVASRQGHQVGWDRHGLEEGGHDSDDDGDDSDTNDDNDYDGNDGTDNYDDTDTDDSHTDDDYTCRKKCLLLLPPPSSVTSTGSASITADMRTVISAGAVMFLK